MNRQTVPDDFYQDDEIVALEAVLKTRHAVSRGASITFQRFDEIFNFLKQNTFEQQEVWALEDLSLYDDMPAEDWIHLFRDLSQKHASKLEDVPSHS